MNKWNRSYKSKIKINSSRYYLLQFLKRASNELPPGAKVLDAGAGDCRYQELFSHASYESADFRKVDKPYGKLTYVCDLSSIPVEDDRFDMIICTQVLEHLPEPGLVLIELFRVLKPEGTLWLSAPLFFPEHEEPYDFYRYTRHGFEYRLKSAGFMVDEIEWMEGYFGTLSYQLETAAKALPIRPSLLGGGAIGILLAPLIAILKIAFLILSLFFARLDLRYKYTERGLCKNYTVIATKPLCSNHL